MILIYSEYYFKGGLDRYIIDMVNCVNEEQFIFKSNKNVAIFSNHSLFSLFPKILKPFVFILYYPCIVLNVIKMMKLIDEVKPELINVVNGGYYGGSSCIAMCIAGKIKRKKVVLTVLSTPYKRIVPVLDCFIDYIVDKSVIKVAAICQKTKDLLIKNHGFDEKKIEVVYNGV